MQRVIDGLAAMTAIVLGIVLSAQPVTARAEAAGILDLTYYTEEYRPLNFTDETGRLTGLSVELLRLMWQEMGTPEQPILVRPWARSYRDTLQLDNRVLFATSRTDEREDLFKWVCAISPNRQVVYGPAGTDIRIGSSDELNRYTIGTVRDDVSEQILLQIGVSPSQVQAVTDIEQNIKKLNAGRIDLMAYGEYAARGAIRHLGYALEDYSVVYVMRDTANCYAFSRSTDDAVVTRFQQALDAVTATPAYRQLLEQFDQHL